MREQVVVDSNEQAGFDADEDTQDPNPTGTPGDGQSGEQLADAGQAEQAIEYAQLTKAEWEEVKSRAAELKATQDKSFGTIGNTLRGIQQTIQQLQTGPQVEISQEEIDDLKEFPPLAAALEKIRSMRNIQGAGVDPEKLDEMVRQRLAPALDSIEGRVHQAVEMRLLNKQHPDWREIDKKPEFAAWVQQQPKVFVDQLVEASEKYNSDFIGDTMTKFKQSLKPAPTAALAAPARKNTRMTAAVTPRGSGTTPNAPGTTEEDGFNSA